MKYSLLLLTLSSTVHGMDLTGIDLAKQKLDTAIQAMVQDPLGERTAIDTARDELGHLYRALLTAADDPNPILDSIETIESFLRTSYTTMYSTYRSKNAARIAKFSCPPVIPHNPSPLEHVLLHLYRENRTREVKINNDAVYIDDTIHNSFVFVLIHTLGSRKGKRMRDIENRFPRHFAGGLPIFNVTND